jgi:hypothetical protein
VHPSRAKEGEGMKDCLMKLPKGWAIVANGCIRRGDKVFYRGEWINVPEAEVGMVFDLPYCTIRRVKKAKVSK